MPAAIREGKKGKGKALVDSLRIRFGKKKQKKRRPKKRRQTRAEKGKLPRNQAEKQE